jgi:hypothetical protein
MCLHICTGDFVLASFVLGSVKLMSHFIQEFLADKDKLGWHETEM